MLALIATLPASLAVRLADAPTVVAAASGTVWRGEAMLAGGHRAAWTLDPVRSVRSLSLAARWRIEGPDTRLAGAIGLRPDGVALADVTGRADWSLIAAVAPGLPASCDINLRVDISRALWSRSTRRLVGEVQANPGRCVSTDGETSSELDLPALEAIAASANGETSIQLAPAGDATRILLDAHLAADGALTVTLHPEGARVLAGRAASAPMTLETQL
ncbi:MAG: type II secretion system protein N [Maricaulaceae bacterium]